MRLRRGGVCFKNLPTCTVPGPTTGRSSEETPPAQGNAPKGRRRSRMHSFRPPGVRQIESWPSRLFVTIPASPFHVKVLASFSAKRPVFAPFSVRFVRKRRAKGAQFASFKKVMSFVFKYSFASFPLFFIFSVSRLSPRAGTFPPLLARG